MHASKQQKLRAIDTEIVRSQNDLKYIESKLPPEHLAAALSSKSGK